MSTNYISPKIIFGSGISSHKEYDSFLAVVQKAVENGCKNFDTAPSYRTEYILGQAIRQCIVQYNLTREDFFIQSKIDAWQMQEGDGDIRKYVDSALKEMGMDYFDLVLIHWPIPEYLEKTWKSLQRIKSEGIAKDIGICNVRFRHLKAFSYAGILPRYIQIERHPLMVFEKEIEFCKMNDICIQAYSPLCKMHSHIKESPTLQSLTEKYGKSIGQIVLRWHIDTGVIPVFTSRKPKRVEEYLNIFDFSLSAEDIANVSALNENYKLCLESCSCPGF
nr:aldo/keto reductase [uncultured Desulfobacter sp.]